MRPHAAEQPGHVGRLGGAAAEQPVAAEQPEVARPRDRNRRRLGGLLLARVGSGGVQQRVDLGGLEAEGAEVDAELAEVGHLQRQHRLVPAGLLGQPVVGEDVGALLRSR